MKKESPGTVLNALLKKHGLNYSSLAKAIGLSGAMVRLIALDENPVSAAVAFRLAVFFKMRPEYWLDLQAAFDIAKTAKDKKLAKALKAIPSLEKTVKNAAKPGRKPKAKKAAKKSKPAKKTTGKRGRPAGAKKAKPAKAVKKTTGKRGRPAVKKTGTRGRPAKAKPTAAKVKKAPVSRPVTPQPVNQTNATDNELNLW
ncbi:MAG: HigA family addiction module antidote protein [Treponema sp.]|jgi:addiction module HigA family antidote|nr:HigA family addiction module antidote protein [Treponema sp.]